MTENVSREYRQEYSLWTLVHESKIPSFREKYCDSFWHLLDITESNQERAPDSMAYFFKGRTYDISAPDYSRAPDAAVYVKRKHTINAQDLSKGDVFCYALTFIPSLIIRLFQQVFTRGNPNHEEWNLIQKRRTPISLEFGSRESPINSLGELNAKLDHLFQIYRSDRRPSMWTDPCYLKGGYQKVRSFIIYGNDLRMDLTTLEKIKCFNPPMIILDGAAVDPTIEASEDHTRLSIFGEDVRNSADSDFYNKSAWYRTVEEPVCTLDEALSQKRNILSNGHKERLIQVIRREGMPELEFSA